MNCNSQNNANIVQIATFCTVLLSADIQSVVMLSVILMSASVPISKKDYNFTFRTNVGISNTTL
jgi:hypothetical protein